MLRIWWYDDAGRTQHVCWAVFFTSLVGVMEIWYLAVMQPWEPVAIAGSVLCCVSSLALGMQSAHSVDDEHDQPDPNSAAIPFLIAARSAVVSGNRPKARNYGSVGHPPAKTGANRPNSAAHGDSSVPEPPKPLPDEDGAGAQLTQDQSITQQQSPEREEASATGE